MPDFSAEKVAAPGANLFQAPSLAGLLPGLLHGFSGTLPFSPKRPFGAVVGELCGSVHGGRWGEPVWLEQPHGAAILALDDPSAAAAPARPPAGGYDGAVERDSGGRLLCVRVADCVPVLAVHPAGGAYAALHAGWRGTAAGILPNLLAHWRRAGGRLAGVRLAFGPAIGPCCFEVRADCWGAFDPAHLEGALAAREGAHFLNLTAVLTNQALAAGLATDQIETLPLCTSCHQPTPGAHPFASYRRAKGQGLPTTGRNAAFIGMRHPA